MFKDQKCAKEPSGAMSQLYSLSILFLLTSYINTYNMRETIMSYVKRCTIQFSKCLLFMNIMLYSYYLNDCSHMLHYRQRKAL